MEKKSIEQWIVQGQKLCKSYVFYENKVLDLTDFMVDHPGGMKDITNIVFEVYPHPRDTTLSKLMRFQVGIIPEQEVKNLKHKGEKSLHSDRPKQKKRVCFDQVQPVQHRMNVSMRREKNTVDKSLNRSNKPNHDKDSVHNSKNRSNTTKASQSKTKKKEYLTSIRLIKQQNIVKTYDEYFKENEQKIREKQRATTEKPKGKKQKQFKTSCSFLSNQIDQCKPNFKVPVLCVKQINRNG